MNKTKELTEEEAAKWLREVLGLPHDDCIECGTAKEQGVSIKESNIESGT